MGAQKTWNPKARWQPEREGPVWEAFLKWFKNTNIEAQRRSVAWKAFHASWVLFGKQVPPNLPG